MSTWNRKARVECGRLQALKAAPKRQVQCLKCYKVHDAPVCESSHSKFRFQAIAANRARKKRELVRKAEARARQNPVNIVKAQRRLRRMAKA